MIETFLLVYCGSFCLVFEVKSTKIIIDVISISLSTVKGKEAVKVQRNFERE